MTVAAPNPRFAPDVLRLDRAIAAPGLSYLEKAELLLGRSHWTREDYQRAGEAEFDRIFTASRNPSVGEREHYARAFVDLNCPHSKRRLNGARTKGV